MAYTLCASVTPVSVRRQSACAKLTLKATRNVRVRAPIRLERQSACADPHGRGACGLGLRRPQGGAHEDERGHVTPARERVMRIGAGTVTFPAQAL